MAFDKRSNILASDIQDYATRISSNCVQSHGLCLAKPSSGGIGRSRAVTLGSTERCIRTARYPPASGRWSSLAGP